MTLILNTLLDYEVKRYNKDRHVTEVILHQEVFGHNRKSWIDYVPKPCSLISMQKIQ